MKKFLFTVSLLFVALCVTAQTDDDYSWYLIKAKEQLGKGECDKAQRNYNHYKALAHDSLPSLERKIQECIGVQAQASQKVDTEIVFVPVQVPAPKSKTEQKEKPSRENKFMMFLMDRNNPYCKAERNRYIAWTIAGAGYPWNVTVGVELRGGGILGIGGYADAGIDISQVSFAFDYCESAHWTGHYDHIVHDTIYQRSYKTESNIISFRYVGGIRLYYKGLFVSLAYGSISRTIPTIERDYGLVDDFNAYHEMDILLKEVRKGQGLHFNVGYNLVTGTDYLGFFLGVSGGFAYDIVNKSISPSFNLKLGMSFEWKKY